MSYSNLYDGIRDRVPLKWRQDINRNAVALVKPDNEYTQMEDELKRANLNRGIAAITRIQNVFDYGQFLIREQLLVVTSGEELVYSVRRFVKVKKNFKDMALKYNVDPRRCGLATLTFVKTLPVLSYDDIVFVVRVLTKTPHNENITPRNSLEYYIEYCVELL